MKRLLATLAFPLLLLSSPAVANDTGLKRLTLRHDLLGWEAVGRLDLDGRGYCSGALIAPDLVLTAAHCLIDRRSGERLDPGKIAFQAGLRDGEAIATRAGRRAVIHPDYDAADTGWRQLLADVALLELDAAIPAGHASPFTTSDRTGEGGKVSVVSFARGREKALSWQRSCTTFLKAQGALGFTCDTDFGSSGAPIFENSAGRPRIVSIVSRGRRVDGETEVFGMEIERPLSALRHALRTGDGVWSSEPGAPETPGRQAKVEKPRAKIGARFLRP